MITIDAIHTSIKQVYRDHKYAHGYIMSLSDSTMPTFIYYDKHMILNTRSSCFSMCNIEKAGNMNWG